MTTVVSAKWKSDINGTFATAADWTPGGVPTYGAGDEYDVFIGGADTTGTTAFTVTSAASEQVGFLNIGADATLSVTGGKFQIYSHVYGYSNIYNYGTIKVATGATLSFGVAGSPSASSSEIQNFGAVAVAGTLSLAAPWFGLFGKGTLTLSGAIVGANTGSVATLYNDDGDILGSGSIGAGSTLYLNNSYAGVINANAAARMTINTGTNRISNAGTIESTGAGGLTIDSGMQLDGVLKVTGTGTLVLANALIAGGGATSAAAKSEIVLSNGEISDGGVISVAAAGEIRTTSGDTKGVGTNGNLAGDVMQDSDIADSGAIVVENDSTLNLNATVVGSGVVDLLGSTGPTRLETFNNGLAISNTGGIVLSNSADNAIVSNGTGQGLFNYTKIAGAGVIGDGWLRLANELGSTIDADDSDALTLVADTSAVAAGTQKENYNNSTIENTGAGGLVLSSGTLDNAGYLTEDGVGAFKLNAVVLDNGSGIVRALKGQIILQGNSEITRQAEVTIASGASITTTAGDTSDAILSNFYNSGAVDVVAGSTLDVDNNWTNSGAINVGSATAGATLHIEGGAAWQLFAAGTLHMSNASDAIFSAGANTDFGDTSNLIVGGGTIGDANMSVNIQNGGKVDATLASGMVLNAEALDASTGQTFLYNAGILQSDSAGGLKLDAAIYSPGRMIADSGAKIIADDAVYGNGETLINGTGSVEFHAEADNDVHFGATSGGDLILDSSQTYYGNTFGFGAKDMIDLRDFAFVSGKTKLDTSISSFGALDGTLFVTNGTKDSAPLYLEGNYTSATLAADHLAFQFTSDGHLINGTSSDGTLVKLVSTAT